MNKNNNKIIKFILVILLLAIPIMTYAIDPVTYALTRLADELLPDMMKEFAEGTIANREQSDLLKFQLRFWAAQVGDERLREVVETAIALPGKVMGIDTYDIVDIIFDNWEEIYAGIKNPNVSDKIEPDAFDVSSEKKQRELFLPYIPGPNTQPEEVSNKLAMQKIVLDDHFNYIYMKYFNKQINEKGKVKEKTIKNSVPAFIATQNVNLDALEENFNNALASANMCALLESINRQLLTQNKTDIKILEALTDLNKSVYYLTIQDAYIKIEDEYERQTSR